MEGQCYTQKYIQLFSNSLLFLQVPFLMAILRLQLSLSQSLAISYFVFLHTPRDPLLPALS